MQFSCQSSQLAKAINIVKKAISSSHNSPIFSGIHMILQENVLQLIAMDTNFCMRDILQVNGLEAGELLVPVKAIGDLFTRFDNDEVVTLSQQENEKELTIEASKAHGKYHIPLMDYEDYPALPGLKQDQVMHLKDEMIGSLISSTVYACSTDEQRPLYTGVFFEKKGKTLTAVGTNTHRLAIKTVELEEGDDSNFSMLIPARVLKEISANLNGDLPGDVVLTLENRQLQVEVGDLTIISSLIEGRFPDYTKPIPPSFKNRTVLERTEVEKAVQRVTLFSHDEYSIVRLSLENDRLVLSSTVSDLGQGREELPCVTIGEELPLNIAFNSKYLLEFFKKCDTDRVVLETNSSLSPARLTPENDESYTYIVTPVRVIF